MTCLFPRGQDREAREGGGGGGGTNLLEAAKGQQPQTQSWLILAGGRVVAAEEGGAHTRRTSRPSHLLGRGKQNPGLRNTIHDRPELPAVLLRKSPDPGVGGGGQCIRERT